MNIVLSNPSSIKCAGLISILTILINYCKNIKCLRLYDSFYIGVAARRVLYAYILTSMYGETCG